MAKKQRERPTAMCSICMKLIYLDEVWEAEERGWELVHECGRTLVRERDHGR